MLHATGCGEPAHAFGQPIVSDAGVPTSTLLDAVKAEGSVVNVARLFQVDPRSVRAALRSEKQFAERLAACGCSWTIIRRLISRVG
jgi:uncharacterized protein (DUF433 family)